MTPQTQAQNGSAHGRIYATFKRRLLTNNRNRLVKEEHEKGDRKGWGGVKKSTKAKAPQQIVVRLGFPLTHTFTLPMYHGKLIYNDALQMRHGVFKKRFISTQ